MTQISINYAIVLYQLGVSKEDIRYSKELFEAEKKGVTRLLYLPQNGICQTWKEAFNGYAEVHFDRIISGKTGL